jgi:hypothetical protein
MPLLACARVVMRRKLQQQHSIVLNIRLCLAKLHFRMLPIVCWRAVLPRAQNHRRPRTRHRSRDCVNMNCESANGNTSREIPLYFAEIRINWPKRKMNTGADGSSRSLATAGSQTPIINEFEAA